MNKIWETIKVRAVCEDNGIDERTSRIYAIIHNITNGGKKGADVFELKPGETIESKLGPFKHFSGDGYIEQQIDDTRRLFSDPKYREQMYKSYMNLIQPRVDNYGFKDVLRALKD